MKSLYVMLIVLFCLGSVATEGDAAPKRKGGLKRASTFGGKSKARPKAPVRRASFPAKPKAKPVAAKKPAPPSRSNSTTSLASKSNANDAVTQKHLKDKSNPFKMKQKVETGSVADIQKGKKLGEGSAGAVYQTNAKIGKNNVDVAAKIVPARNMNEKQGKELMSLQKKVGPHPNVIGTLDVQHKTDANGKKVAVIASEMGGKNLGNKDPNGRLPAKQVAATHADAANGLSHMHKKGLYHGDVKPENIVMKGNGKAAVIDWDGAKTMKNGKLAPKPGDMNLGEGNVLNGGSRHFSAPELTNSKTAANNKKMNFKSLDAGKAQYAKDLKKEGIDGGKADVYSLGMSATSQTIGHNAMTKNFAGKSDADRSAALIKAPMSVGMHKTLMDMTSADPAKRPTMDKAASQFQKHAGE